MRRTSGSAWRHAVRLVDVEYDGQERLLAIGPTGTAPGSNSLPAGALQGIVHADRLRPSRDD